MLAVQTPKPHHASWLEPPPQLTPGKVSIITQKRPQQLCKMPSLEALRHFGLQAGDRARSRDTECSICKENVKDPVVTQCAHIYCFECIYQWFSHSTRCPDCRRDLYQARIKQPVQRFSSSTWVRASTSTAADVQYNPQPALAVAHVSDGHKDSGSGQASNDPDPEAEIIPYQEPERLQTACLKVQLNSYQYRTMPLASQGRRGHRRSTPSFGSSAYHNVEYHPPQSVGIECEACAYLRHEPYDDDDMTAEDRAIHEIVRHNGGQIPRSTTEHDAAAARAQVVVVDAEQMLADMWSMSQTASDGVQVPIRCRAIMKCIWREWRDFLHRQDGRWLLAEGLLKALSQSIERTVVDYGWVQSWQELPDAFLRVLKHTAQAATQTGNLTKSACNGMSM